MQVSQDRPFPPPSRPGRLGPSAYEPPTKKRRGGSRGMSVSFARQQGPPSLTARLVRAVLRRRFVGRRHSRTAHSRRKPANSRTPAATALPCHLPAKRSAYARLCRGFPGMNRLRKRPAYAGALRLLDVGQTRAWIFPPEPPLFLPCADAMLSWNKSAPAPHRKGPPLTKWPWVRLYR